MDILELKLDYENPAYCRTHYIGTYKSKKYNIVILHDKIEEICTASKDGEPNAPLKEGIKVLLNGQLYEVVKNNGYSTLKSVVR